MVAMAEKRCLIVDDSPQITAWSASRCDRHMTRGSTTQKHETRRMRAGVSSKAGEDSSLGSNCSPRKTASMQARFRERRSFA
jgi:hypothetical protein